MFLDCDQETGSSVYKGSVVWCSKKPSNRDHDATVCFLQLREKYGKQFEDRKTIKNQLWQKIATEMQNAGYYIGEGKEAAERCRQKFANLQKQYMNHVKHMTTTGEQRKDPPPFFEEMHNLLGSKDKVNPKNLQDSLMEQINIHDENKENTAVKENESPTYEIKNRFSSCKQSVRPKHTNSEIIELLKTHHHENREERNAHLKSLEKLLMEQNRQRERLLNQFQTLIDYQKHRKRKHKSSSDSE